MHNEKPGAEDSNNRKRVLRGGCPSAIESSGHRSSRCKGRLEREGRSRALAFTTRLEQGAS